ncbi:MAG: hypothetical protein BroJett001_31600 [Chloroflexota bacterium]|nr:MAG: hypothetical protein BroJett001_31600 [Chloroflexota bacterium]
MSVVPLFPAPLTVADLTAAHATLPIIELDRARVERERARIRPLPDARDQLRITAWSLYHAAKKAELACSFTTDQIDHLARCFANEHHGLFRWNGEELRLTAGVTDMYESAAQASRARLIGEGMLLLAMQHEGHAFWDRFDLLVKRALRRQLLDHPESVRRARAIRKRIDAGRNGKRSDFVVENAQRQSALAEAKGGFLSPFATSAIKSDLREALQQLAATKPLIAPQPAKTYAVGTYLREADDGHDEGSLIAFVDPEGQDDADLTIELPPDWVRRGNYAAWLLGMGLVEAADALRNGIARDGISVSLPVKRVGRHDYAYVVTGAGLNPRHLRRFLRDFRHHWPHHWAEWFFFGPGRREVELSIIGLRVDVLDSISGALTTTEASPLLSVEPAFEIDTAQFGGSVMPDGSMCGAITVESIREIEFREFTL